MGINAATLFLLLIVAAGCSPGNEYLEENVVQELAEEPHQDVATPHNDLENKPEPAENKQEELADKSTLVMFHNNRGLMCLEQLDFLQEMREKYPTMMVEEILTTTPEAVKLLAKYKSGFNESFGVSSSFKFLPITFINNHAYSGYSLEVSKRLENDIMEVCR